MIAKCSCASEFQDDRYGVGMRVFNPLEKFGSTGEARCAKCGRVAVVAKRNRQGPQKTDED